MTTTICSKTFFFQHVCYFVYFGSLHYRLSFQKFLSRSGYIFFDWTLHYNSIRLRIDRFLLKKKASEDVGVQN